MFGRSRDGSRTETDQYGFFPCAPGCRGSDSDPRSCHCVCRGVNHGALLFQRPIRPIVAPADAESFGREEARPRIAQTLALPSTLSRETGSSRDTWSRPSPSFASGPLPRISYKRKLARGIGKHVFKYQSETFKNETILKGLHYQFSDSRVDSIVDQAYTVYYERDPEANRPELYELFENGSIDRALETFNVRWVIGRPKL